MHQQKSDIPAGMEKVRRRLERWRKARRGREGIPQGLWVTVGSLAREYGVNPTSKALGLEFKKVKSYAEAAHRRRKTPAKAPQFLELMAAVQPFGSSECVIELEGPRGKMRIEWKGPTARDLAELSRILLEKE